MDIGILITDKFSTIRRGHGYYVDKTGFLLNFLHDPSDSNTFRAPNDVTLFTRPRRFGKTLFMSMLADFFDNQKDSRDLFTGLQVTSNEKLCHECMNKCPVIFLSFADEKWSNFDSALFSIGDIICKFCNQHKYLLTSDLVDDDDKTKIKKYMSGIKDPDVLAVALKTLSNAMACHHGREVILLIDEYDTPLVTAWEHNYYADMANFMRIFYPRGLKTNYSLKFAILTGILRVAKESIFSGLNNLVCYDITEEAYADLFGFTQKEVDSLLVKFRLQDKREAIRVWYDGYHIGAQTDIYNPWSIMQYLDALRRFPRKSPKAYWINSSSNELVIDFIHKFAEDEAIRAKLFALRGGNPIAAQINPEMNYRDIYAEADNLWTLLYLSGYLTDAKDSAVYPGKVAPDETILVVPNQEIATIFQRELTVWIEKLLSKEERDALFDALWGQNVQAFERILNDLLVGSGVHDQKELYYHGMMFGILALGYKEVISSGEGGMGFYDLLVVDRENSRAAVLELKRVASANELEQYAGKALKQIVDRCYDARVRAEGSCKTILHVGIAFCDKTAKVLFKDSSLSPGQAIHPSIPG